GFAGFPPSLESKTNTLAVRGVSAVWATRRPICPSAAAGKGGVISVVAVPINNSLGAGPAARRFSGKKKRRKISGAVCLKRYFISIGIGLMPGFGPPVPCLLP